MSKIFTTTSVSSSTPITPFYNSLKSFAKPAGCCGARIFRNQQYFRDFPCGLGFLFTKNVNKDLLTDDNYEYTFLETKNGPLTIKGLNKIQEEILFSPWPKYMKFRRIKSNGRIIINGPIGHFLAWEASRFVAYKEKSLPENSFVFPYFAPMAHTEASLAYFGQQARPGLLRFFSNYIDTIPKSATVIWVLGVGQEETFSIKLEQIDREHKILFKSKKYFNENYPAKQYAGNSNVNADKIGRRLSFVVMEF